MGGSRDLESASSDSTTEKNAERIVFYQEAVVPCVDNSPYVECKCERQDISSESKSGEKIFTCTATVTQGQSTKTYTLCKQKTSDSTSLHPLDEAVAGRVINQDNIVTLWQLISIKIIGRGTRKITRSVHLYVYSTKTQAFNKLDLGDYSGEAYSIEPFYNNTSNKFILRKKQEAWLFEIASNGVLSRDLLGEGYNVVLSPCERFVAVHDFCGPVSLYEYSDRLRLIARLKTYTYPYSMSGEQKEASAELRATRVAFRHDALIIVDLNNRVLKKALSDDSSLELLDSTKASLLHGYNSACINEEGNLVLTRNRDDKRIQTEFTFSSNEEYQLSVVTSVIADEVPKLPLVLCRLTAGYAARIQLFTVPRQLPQFKFFYEIDAASKERLLAIAKALNEKEKSAFSHFLHCVDDGMEVSESIDSALKKYGKVLPADGVLKKLFTTSEPVCNSLLPEPSGEKTHLELCNY